MRELRFWVVVVLMCATAAIIHIRGDVDRVPASEPLSQLPLQIGSRVATEIPLDDEVLQVLGKGIFLNRIYEAAPSGASAAATPPISLFIGYFPTQRTGQAIHSPQNCLPGAGWSFLSSGVTDLSESGGHKDQVGEYLISDGRTSQEVLYWYRVHGRSIASDYKAKLYTVADSIRYSRTDAALIRIITPLMPGEDRASAHDRVVRFADRVAPMLPAYIPN